MKRLLLYLHVTITSMKKLLLPLCLLMLLSCSKKDPEPSVIIDSPTLDLKYDQQHEFKLKKGAEDIFPSTFNWVSSDEKVGKVDANGLFKSRKIGKATITGTSKEGGSSVISDIVVSPYTSFIVEPSVEFGATKQTIKSQEKRSLATESTDVILFDDSDPLIRFIGYLFENGRCTSSVVIFENTTRAVEQAGTFYKERYPEHGVIDDGVLGFISDARTHSVMMSVSDQIGFNALYFPYDEGGRVSGVSVRQAKEILANTIQNSHN